jgi:lipoate---protein ligase
MMHGEYKTPSGKLVVVDCSVRAGRLADVEVSGDFFLEPPEALGDITAALEGLDAGLGADAIAARLRDALGAEVAMVGFGAESVAEAVRRAVG